MCVINAAIVIFLIAESRGERLSLAARVRHAAVAAEVLVDATVAAQPSGERLTSSVPAVASRRTSSDGGLNENPALLRNFVDLLGFWGDVYETHSCERRFLEFSSGIPFSRWQSVVRKLKRDFLGSTSRASADSHLARQQVLPERLHVTAPCDCERCVPVE